MHRPGDLFFFGAGCAIFFAQFLHIGPAWLIAGALFGGWILNEQERRRHGE